MRTVNQVCAKPVKLAVVLLALALAMPSDAHAYADPGTGALLWQTLVAGFIGGVFFFRQFVAWFKGKIKGQKG